MTMRIATLAIVLTLAHTGMAAAQTPDEAAAIEQTVL